MFPRGAPGVALVLLRFAVAATLWAGVPEHCRPAPLVFLLLTMALCLGMLTPLAAVLCAFLHGAGIAWCEQAQTLPAIVAVAHASALALLGPGAYSIDCRLFGRRVFVVTGGSAPP